MVGRPLRREGRLDLGEAVTVGAASDAPDYDHAITLKAGERVENGGAT
ncbi:MAG TPA: hypothetical protein VJN18_20875 [Polyangiaceae bacterium]|nr:hypothetical protein [Polyangiaceae bacterium]